MAIDKWCFYWYAVYMQRRTKALLITSSVLFLGVAIYMGVYHSQSPATVSSVVSEGPVVATSARVLELVNQERSKAGVPQLVEDVDVANVAQMKATDMFTRSYSTHNLPSSNKILSEEMVEAHKGKCAATSENLFAGTGVARSAENVVKGWMESPPHKEAMLNPTYRLTGIGVSGSSELTIVQHFCITN